MAVDSTLREFREECRIVAAFDMTLVYDNPEHKQLKMPELTEACRVIQSLCRAMESANWPETLPTQTIAAGRTHLHQFLGALRNAAIIHLAANDRPDTWRQNAINTVHARFSDVASWYSQSAWLARDAGSSPDAGWRSLREIVAKGSETVINADHTYQKLIGDAKGLAERATSEVNEILAGAKTTAAQAAATKQSKAFEDAAAQHSKTSQRWLIAGFVFLGLTGAATYFLLLAGANGDLTAAGTAAGTTVHAFRESIGNLAVVVILFLVANTCLRNYRANKHLGVTNEHRARALETFHAFAAAARDDDSRDYVLREATRCVFGRVPSGYLTKESESLTPLVEAAKSAR